MIRRTTLLSLLCPLALGSLPSGAEALPIYAAKELKQCTHCHVDPDGGGPRNVRGRYYEANEHSFAGFSEEMADGGDAASPLQGLMEALSFSGDLRMVYSVSEGPHASGFSGCESCHSPGGRAPDQSFFLMQGELAVSADLSEQISFAYSNDLGITRDVYGIVRLGGTGTYLKAGAFEVPYGLDDIDDHNSLIKSRHNIGSNVRDVGVQLVARNQRRFASVALLNGGDRFSQSAPVLGSSIDPDGTPAVVGRAGLILPRGRIGVSVLHDNSGRGGSEPRETFGGVYGTIYAGPTVFTGEIDIGTESIGAADRTNLGFVVQGTFDINRKLEVGAKVDRYDPDTDADDDAETWFTLFAEHRISQHASVQGRVRIREEEFDALPGAGGKDSPSLPGNDDALLMLRLRF